MSFSNNTSLTSLAFIILFSATLVASRFLPDKSSYMISHDQWMAQYGRVYKNDNEKDQRSKIYQENIQYIESFNKAGNKGYTLAINDFADLTNIEFTSIWTGFKESENSTTTTPFRYENVTEVPSEMDWRKEGAVNQIKQQRNCGSCWAFSTVAAVEGITMIKAGKLVSLSEQELVDCDTGNYGCEGGFKDKAFEFIINNNGLATESAYPYEGVKGTCKSDIDSAATITGYEDVPANSESELLKAVASQPVSVAIDANGRDFQFYKSGVFRGGCDTKLNHAVIIVGYGTSDDGIKYWLVRNSWGTNWGQDGYIMMERDVGTMEGLCGIAKKPSYPTID